MDAAVSDALKDIFSRHGRELFDNPRVGAEIVRENLGKSRKLEAALLNTVMQKGVPSRLLNTSAASLTRTLVANYATSIARDTGLKEDLARWAIEAWIDGLGLRIAGVDDPSLDRTEPEPSIIPGASARVCPFCGAPAGTQLCSACGRDTTAPRRPCPKCKKMVPSGEATCWNCGSALPSDLRWKITVIVILSVLTAFLVFVESALMK